MSITTSQVFELYYKNVDPETERKTRPQIDRPEVYAYEKEIGKQIFDMDIDELTEMLLSFNNDREYGKKSQGLSIGSIDQIASFFRSVFNFYIDEIRIIRNPWNDKRMRGAALEKRILANREPYDLNIVDKCIELVYGDFPTGAYMPKYLETILLLFYNGFSESSQIARLTEDMINFETREVNMDGRRIHLSERCMELLQYFHNLDEVSSDRITYQVVSWHGSYFKFIVRPKEAATFDSRDLRYVSAIITRKITMQIKKRFDIDINYRTVYLLGFYKFMIGKIGEKRTREILTSMRDAGDTRQLLELANEYGVISDNPTNIKKCLRIFL